MFGNRPVLWLVIVGLCGCGCYGLCRAVFTSAQHEPDPCIDSTGDISELVRDEPLLFGVVNTVSLPQSSSNFARYTTGTERFVLPADTVPDPSLCLHLLKFLGWDGAIKIGAENNRQDVMLRDLIFDGDLAKKYLGDASFTATRYGLRFPTKIGYRGHVADESHRDQCLAMLAELGVKLSQELVLEGETHRLRDVLRDSLANFHLGQKELAWTTVAYASYLPPRTRWKNRFGMEFSFDELALAMMDRPRDQLSCGGTHVYYALTVLLRADREMPILSSDTRQALIDYVRIAVETACQCQNPDGTWNVEWWRDETDQTNPMSVSSRVLITGHMAEWLMYVPEDLFVSDYVLRRAGLWLSGHLAETQEKTFWKEVCPYTHAIVVVQSSR